MMDAQYIKSKINDEGLIKIIKSLGGELAFEVEDAFVFTSITYSVNADEHKPKLYCYKSNYMFVEYHLGMETFDVFDLVKERFKLLGKRMNFISCMNYICDIIGLSHDMSEDNSQTENYVNLNLKRFTEPKKPSELRVYDESILDSVFFHKWYHQSWIDDNISIDTMEKYGILYDDFKSQIIIPCRNEKGELIGVRARNLDPNANMKYIPYQTINGTWYKFNVGQTFFGLNFNAQAIRKFKKVVICESEKSVMQGDTYFGDNNIILGMYGSAMTPQKKEILLGLGIDELIIAVDFDYVEESYSNPDLYEELTDWEKYENKVYKIADMFRGWCAVSVIIDYHPKHKKDCVTDYGKAEYLQFIKNRRIIYGGDGSEM